MNNRFKELPSRAKAGLRKCPCGGETAMFYDEEERYRVECADCDFVMKFRSNSWDKAVAKFNSYVKEVRNED